MRFVQARGSFYEVALKVGEECRSDIPEVYQRGVDYLLNHTNVGSLARINQIAARYMASANSLWSESVDFLRGLADGANVPMDVIAVTAFTEEVSSEVGIIPADKCSTFVRVFADGKIGIIHNEDYEKHNLGKMVLLDVVFDGFPRSVGLTYSGQLFNLAGSINARHVALTNNGFYPLAQSGSSKQVLHARASLTQSMRGAKTWLSMQPIAVTTHYVIVCGETKEAVSLIVSNLKTAKSEMNVCEIKGVFYCTNHVPAGRLDLLLPDPAILASPNSFDRYNRLASLKPEELPQTILQGVDLFCADPVIFRTTGDSVTLATVAICPETGEFLVRDANPYAVQRDWYFSV